MATCPILLLSSSAQINSSQSQLMEGYKSKYLTSNSKRDFPPSKDLTVHICCTALNSLILFPLILSPCSHSQAPFSWLITPSYAHHPCSAIRSYRSVSIYPSPPPSNRYTRTPLSCSLCLRALGRRLPRMRTVMTTARRTRRRMMSRRQRVKRCFWHLHVNMLSLYVDCHLIPVLL